MRFLFQVALADAAGHLGEARSFGHAGASSLLGHALDHETDPCVAACLAEASADPDLYRFDEPTLERLIAELEATRDGKPTSRLHRWGNESPRLLDLRTNQLAATRTLGPRRAELVREVEHWALLFELDSHLEADLCFCDAWHVQVTIRRDDLARGRFDRTRAKLSRACVVSRLNRPPRGPRQPTPGISRGSSAP